MRYLIDQKTRKALCRVPQLLKQGRGEAALAVLSRLEPADKSPLLLAHRITSLEVAGRSREARSAFHGRRTALEAAKKKGPDEILPFFLHLFGFYLNRDLETAEKVFRAGKAYGMDKAGYGMLWVKYCDRTGRIDEGLDALETYFKGKKKLTSHEVGVVRKRYPALARDRRFLGRLGGER